MATKAYYPISEIGAGKVGFSKTRSIIEAAFYGNNVVKVNTLKEAYELAKNSPGTIITDMPIKDGETFGLEKDAKVLLFKQLSTPCKQLFFFPIFIYINIFKKKHGKNTNLWKLLIVYMT